MLYEYRIVHRPEKESLEFTLNRLSRESWEIFQILDETVIVIRKPKGK